MNKNKISQGFTLVEILITLVIIAIISTLAYNSYQGVINKKVRALLVIELQYIASELDKQYSLEHKYNLEKLLLKLPAKFKQGNNIVYQFNNKQLYLIEVKFSTDETAYTIVANPTLNIKQDKCGIFVLNSNGRRTNINNTATVSSCWGFK